MAKSEKIKIMMPEESTMLLYVTSALKRAQDYKAIYLEDNSRENFNNLKDITFTLSKYVKNSKMQMFSSLPELFSLKTIDEISIHKCIEYIDAVSELIKKAV